MTFLPAGVDPATLLSGDSTLTHWEIRVRKFWYDHADETNKNEVICYVPFTEFMYSLELNGAGGGQVSFDLESDFLDDGDLYEQLTSKKNLCWEFLFNGYVVAQFVSTKFFINYVDGNLGKTATISGPGLLEAFARVGVFPPGHVADGTDYAFPMAFSGSGITAQAFWAATDIPRLSFWKNVYEGSTPRHQTSSSPINHVGISFTGTTDSNDAAWEDTVDFEPGQGQPNGGSLVDLLQANATTISADYYVRPSQTPPGNLLSDPIFAEGDAIGDGDSGWTLVDPGSSSAGFSTTEQRSGTRCAQVNLSSTSDLPRLTTDHDITVDPRSWVTATVWIKAAAGVTPPTGGVAIQTRTYNSEGLDSEYPPVESETAEESVEERYYSIRSRFYVPTGHDRLTLRVKLHSGGATNTFYVDDVALYGDFATLDVAQDYGDDYSDNLCFFDSNVLGKRREVDVVDCENIVASSMIDDEHDAFKLHVSRDFKSLLKYGRKEKWIDEVSTTIAQATVVETRVEQYKNPISSWAVDVPPYSVVVVDPDLGINPAYEHRATITNRAGIDYSVGDYIGVSSERGGEMLKTSMPLRIQALSGQTDSQGEYRVELTMESLSQLLRRLPPGETRALTSFSGQYWAVSNVIPQAYICKAGGVSVMHGALAVVPPPPTELVPTATTVREIGGFTSTITNYDEFWTWDVDVWPLNMETAPNFDFSLEDEGGFPTKIVVTGLPSEGWAQVEIACLRYGHPTGELNFTAQALRGEPLIPVFANFVWEEADAAAPDSDLIQSFTFDITNYDFDWEWEYEAFLSDEIEPVISAGEPYTPDEFLLDENPPLYMPMTVTGVPRFHRTVFTVDTTRESYEDGTASGWFKVSPGDPGEVYGPYEYTVTDDVSEIQEPYTDPFLRPGLEPSGGGSWTEGAMKTVQYSPWVGDTYPLGALSQLADDVGPEYAGPYSVVWDEYRALEGADPEGPFSRAPMLEIIAASVRIIDAPGSKAYVSKYHLTEPQYYEMYYPGTGAPSPSLFPRYAARTVKAGDLLIGDILTGVGEIATKTIVGSTVTVTIVGGGSPYSGDVDDDVTAETRSGILGTCDDDSTFDLLPLPVVDPAWMLVLQPNPVEYTDGRTADMAFVQLPEFVFADSYTWPEFGRDPRAYLSVTRRTPTARVTALISHGTS